MTRYIFWANSIPGLEIDVELMAINYKCARRTVLKYIATRTGHKHLVKEVKPSSWEQ